MTISSVAGRAFLLGFLVLCWTGCSPPSESESDEQKNPHFLTGRNRLTQMDYNGAIQAFEKALEANPRSASAHLELGLLYEQRMNDCAAAIYHYEKHLKLRPSSNVAQMVRDRIASCKVELAKTVPFALVSQQVQAGLDKLTSENAALRQQLDQLKAQLAQPPAAVPNRAESPPNPTPPPQISTTRVERAGVRLEKTNAPATTTNSTNSTRPTAKPATHAVKSRETLASIARAYGISLPALQSANPRVDARRLKVGQVLQIPSPKN